MLRDEFNLDVVAWRVNLGLSGSLVLRCQRSRLAIIDPDRGVHGLVHDRGSRADPRQAACIHYPLHLEANASVMLSMLELVRKGEPDSEGQMIPGNTRIGSLKIAGTSPDVRDLVTLL